jgi:hypothetical protein
MTLGVTAAPVTRPADVAASALAYAGGALTAVGVAWWILEDQRVRGAVLAAVGLAALLGGLAFRRSTAAWRGWVASILAIVLGLLAGYEWLWLVGAAILQVLPDNWFTRIF